MATKVDNMMPSLMSMREIERLLDMKRVDLCSIAEEVERYYKPFHLVKERHGKVKNRHIDNPTGRLKYVQSRINNVILKKVALNFPDGVVGGVAGKSILDNARPHVRKQVVATLDISECYPSTTSNHVLMAWKIIGSGNKTSKLLTLLTTYQDHLPQGAPTSPLLCNLVLMPLYEDICKLFSQGEFAFTLYVDDITVSGKRSVIEKIIPRIFRLVRKHGYVVNDKFDIVSASGPGPQKTTGLNVNRGITKSREYLNSVRKETIEVAKQGKVGILEKQRILSKIGHVESIDFSKGRRLREFAESLICGLEEYRDEREKETRYPCDCAFIK